MLNFFTVTILLVFTGCTTNQNASSVNQTKIYPSYFISYDDTDQSLTAVANFNFGGPTGSSLVLDATSFVQFDAVRLPSNRQLSYTKTFNGLAANEIWGEHYFLYQDYRGTTYTNGTQLPSLPVIVYSNSPASVSVSLSVLWTTPDILGPDTISLNGKNPDGSAAFTVGNTTLNNAGTGGTLVVTQNQMQTLGAGLYTIQVCRTRTVNAGQSASVGATLITKVCTVRQNFTFTS